MLQQGVDSLIFAAIIHWILVCFKLVCQNARATLARIPPSLDLTPYFITF